MRTGKVGSVAWILPARREARKTSVKRLSFGAGNKAGYGVTGKTMKGSAESASGCSYCDLTEGVGR